MVALVRHRPHPSWQLALWVFASSALLCSSYNIAKFAPLKKHWVEGRSNKAMQAEFRNWMLNNPVLSPPPTKLEDITLILRGLTTRQVAADTTAHALQLALNYKGLSFARQIIPPGQTPLWLADDYEGRLPCVTFKEKVMFDPYEIATVLDKELGGKSISRTREGDPKEVIERTKGLIPSLTTFLFDVMPDKPKEAFNQFVAQLDILEDILQKQHRGAGAGAYLCGREPSIADFVLMPQLYHMEIGLRHFKNFQISAATRGPLNTQQVAQDMVGQHHRLLKMYMLRAFRQRDFMPDGGRYSTDHVAYEWKLAKKEAYKAANISSPVSIPYSNVARPRHLTGRQLDFID